MFYKTANGAEVGDIYMSLIHTCDLYHVNPFAYFQALQIHAKDVMEHAAAVAALELSRTAGQAQVRHA